MLLIHATEAHVQLLRLPLLCSALAVLAGCSDSKHLPPVVHETAAPSLGHDTQQNSHETDTWSLPQVAEADSSTEPTPLSDPPVWGEYAALGACEVGPYHVALCFVAHFNHHDGAFKPAGKFPISAYGLFVDHAKKPIQVIPADQRRSFLREGLNPDTTYFFQVQAADIWGNWSTNGPSVTAKTECSSFWEDKCPAWWPDDAALWAGSSTAASVLLAWTPAQDNMEVRYYRVTADGIMVNPQGGLPRNQYSTTGDTTRLHVVGLAPGLPVVFQVFARDMSDLEYGGKWVPGPVLEHVPLHQ